MLPIIALVLASIAVLLAAGALAMTIQNKKQFTPLLHSVRRLEESPAQAPAAEPAEPVAVATPPEPAPQEPERSPTSLDSPRPDRRELGSATEEDRQPPARTPDPEPAASPSPPAPLPEGEGGEKQAARPEPTKADPPPVDPKWSAWLDTLRSLPHGAVAALLGEVLQHSKHLARGFASAEQREAFTMDVGQGFHRRLTHFQQCAHDPSTFVERWVEPDLITALDLLARFHSQAAADARDGHAPAAQLAAWLGGALYDQLGPACQAEGWFALERIAPFETPFDPALHKGIDGRAVAGARGLVVEVERVGRLHPVDGYPTDKAHVVVGR